MHPTIGNELAHAAMADLCQQAHLLWVIVNGFSLEETRTGDPERPGPDLSSEVTRYFASLPGDRFPNLVAVADEFANTDWDERYDLLITIFIDGLTAQARLS